jgi:hypothetical protein
MTVVGHFRQIDPLPTLSACPLRSDRVRTFAPQRIDAVCQKPTLAMLTDDLVDAPEEHRRSRRGEGGAQGFKVGELPLDWYQVSNPSDPSARTVRKGYESARMSR